MPISSEQGIMYYYYSVKIFKKTKKWELVSQRRSYDFPTITQFKSFLNHLLNKVNPVETGQKHEYRSGKTLYSITLYTEGFACDDFYEITKFVTNENVVSHFNLYVGVSFDIQGDLNSTGIRLSHLSLNDITELNNCITKFVNYSIEVHNKRTQEYVDEHLSNKKILGNKLYIIDKTDNIREIIVAGDVGDFTVITKQDEKVSEEEHCFKTINKIEGDTITLTDETTIKVDSLVNIFIDVPKEKLLFGIDEISKDFLNILDETEINEFKEKNIDILYEKYRNAIISRTWMCRNEHPFTDVSGSVIKVIKLIKNNI